MTIAATFFSTPTTGMPIPAPSEPMPKGDAGFSGNVEAALKASGVQAPFATIAQKTVPLATPDPTPASLAGGTIVTSQQSGSLSRRPPVMVEEAIIQRPDTSTKRLDTPALLADEPLLTDGDTHPRQTVSQPRSEPPATKPVVMVAEPAAGAAVQSSKPALTDSDALPGKPIYQPRSGPPAVKPTALIDEPAASRAVQAPASPPALAGPAPSLIPIPVGAAAAAVPSQNAPREPAAEVAEDSLINVDAAQTPVPEAFSPPPGAVPHGPPAVSREPGLIAAAAPTQQPENAPALADATSAGTALIGAKGAVSAHSDEASVGAPQTMPSFSPIEAEPAPIEAQPQSLSRGQAPKLPGERIDIPLTGATETKAARKSESGRASRGTPSAPVPPPPLTRLQAPTASPLTIRPIATTPSEPSAAPIASATVPTPPIASEAPVASLAVARPAAGTEGAAAQPAAAAAASPAALTTASDKLTPPQPTLPNSASPEAEVPARAGHIGHATGVAIAKRITAGGEELTVRLSPAEFGKVEVRMAFDDRGTLRAVVAAERPEALELLRRDSADLTRAVMDAGIRADQQSFRFDARSGGGDAQGFWQRQQQQQRQQSGGHGNENHVSTGPQEPVYQQLRTAGRVNLMA